MKASWLFVPNVTLVNEVQSEKANHSIEVTLSGITILTIEAQL